jgi:hypothetical protein
MMKDWFDDIIRAMMNGRRRILPDNAHARRAQQHADAAARWPVGSAVRAMHQAACASDARLALGAA